MQADRSRLETFEMWIWRRTEKISWKDKKAHEEILHMVQEDRKILNTTRYWKHMWMGHMLQHDGILHDILEGRMLGKSTKRKKTDSVGRRLIRNKEIMQIWRKQLKIGASGEQ